MGDVIPIRPGVADAGRRDPSIGSSADIGAVRVVITTNDGDEIEVYMDTGFARGFAHDVLDDADEADALEVEEL